MKKKKFIYVLFRIMEALMDKKYRLKCIFINLGTWTPNHCKVQPYIGAIVSSDAYFYFETLHISLLKLAVGFLNLQKF